MVSQFPGNNFQTTKQRYRRMQNPRVELEFVETPLVPGATTSLSGGQTASSQSCSKLL